MGIDRDRFRLEWISASEGEKVRRVMNEVVEKVRALGPLALPACFREWDQELEDQATGTSAVEVEEVAASVH
jgi:F420-non-reducing hydrogenase iron-sulfur subunit